MLCLELIFLLKSLVFRIPAQSRLSSRPALYLYLDFQDFSLKTKLQIKNISNKVFILNFTELNYGGCSSMAERATVARETGVQFSSSALNEVEGWFAKFDRISAFALYEKRR